jgi:hypothetical protein
LWDSVMGLDNVLYGPEPPNKRKPFSSFLGINLNTVP